MHDKKVKTSRYPRSPLRQDLLEQIASITTIRPGTLAEGYRETELFLAQARQKLTKKEEQQNLPQTHEAVRNETPTSGTPPPDNLRASGRRDIFLGGF